MERAAIYAQPDTRGWLVGTSAEVASQLEELEGLGLSEVQIHHLAYDDLEFPAYLGEALAPAVKR